jgi:hypothetical protein
MGAIYDFFLGERVTDATRYQRRHRRDGLCVECKRQALPEHVRCRYHHEKILEVSRRYYAAMKQKGQATN